MNRRIQTFPFDFGGVASVQLIQKDACEVYWVTAGPNAAQTAGDIELYDGFDVGGILKWHTSPYEDAQFNFVPPIPCEQGLTIVGNAAMGRVTVGYRPKKWDRPKTHPLDVIGAETP